MTAPTFPGLARKDFVLNSGSIDELDACPGRGAYAYDGPREPMHAGMWWGIFIHRFLEYAKTRGRAAALRYVAPKFRGRIWRTCACIDLSAIPDGETEASLAFDPFHGEARKLPGGPAGIRACVPELDQFGRADLLSSRRGLPHVIDYKSGEGPHGDPAACDQLLGLASSARVLAGTGGAYVSLVGVASSGSLHWRTALLARADLDSRAIRARIVHEKVAEARVLADMGIAPEFVRNEHCGWCDRRPACPAWKGGTR